MMNTVSTHILDTSTGRPAAGVSVTLESQKGATWKEISRTSTNSEGRVASLASSGVELGAGVYRLHFETQAYFKSKGLETFYPQVTVVFELKAKGEHYHIPLLVSPFGYSTYRGS